MRCLAATLLLSTVYVTYSGTTLSRPLRLLQQSALAECAKTLMGGNADQLMQQMRAACSKGSNLNACCAAARRAFDHCLCDETMYKEILASMDAKSVKMVLQTCNVPNIGTGNC